MTNTFTLDTDTARAYLLNVADEGDDEWGAPIIEDDWDPRSDSDALNVIHALVYAVQQVGGIVSGAEGHLIGFIAEHDGSYYWTLRMGTYGAQTLITTPEEGHKIGDPEKTGVEQALAILEEGVQEANYLLNRAPTWLVTWTGSYEESPSLFATQDEQEAYAKAWAWLDDLRPDDGSRVDLYTITRTGVHAQDIPDREPQPQPSTPAPIGSTVATLTISHRHGEDTTVYADEAAAKLGLDAYVRSCWDDDGPGGAIPEDVDEAITAYFEHAEREDWAIGTHVIQGP